MFDLESTGGATVISAVADIDIASARQLQSIIDLSASTSPLPLVVSLEQCPYCDSTGLSILVRTWKRLGNRFAIVASRESPCYRVLEITGLDQTLPVYSTLELATRGFIEAAS
jgi:anti-anti-sigma factor